MRIRSLMYSIFVSHSAGPHFTGQIVFGMTPASRTEHLGANCCPVSEGQLGVQSCSRQSALRKCCSQAHKHQGTKIFIWNEKFKNPTNKQKGGESIIIHTVVLSSNIISVQCSVLFVARISWWCVAACSQLKTAETHSDSHNTQ